MKKVINVIKIFLIIMIILSNFCQVFAGTIEGLYAGDDVTGVAGTDKVAKIINMIIGTIQVVGVFVAIAFLIFIGIKYMVASPGEKADIKKHLVAYVVGAIVMFGAAGLLEIIETFALNATA